MPGRSTITSRRCGWPVSSSPAGTTLPDRAADLLCHIHDCLLATSQSPACPAPLRASALRHSRNTHTELLAFVRRHGSHDGIQRCLGQCLCQAEPASRLH
ncbi:hypothetical protein D3C79_686820 [compost metagenome]